MYKQGTSALHIMSSPHLSHQSNKKMQIATCFDSSETHSDELCHVSRELSQKKGEDSLMPVAEGVSLIIPHTDEL